MATIKTPLFEFSTGKDGEWIFKSRSVKKKDGTLKKKWHDLPRFKLILTWEGLWKRKYELQISKMGKELHEKLNSFTK